MTIRQFINKNGWQIECDSLPSRYMCVDVNFSLNGETDETQFIIRSYDVTELATLFSEFCKENGYALNTVTGITIVKLAETREQLS